MEEIAGIEKKENEFLQEKSGEVKNDEEVIQIRKEKVVKFFKEKYVWLTYVILAVIVFIAVRIRTRNLPGLKDVTTGGWALGPDLDPWLFTRWAEYIVEHGKLMTVDIMRYVPLGFQTKEELLLHPYMMAWFHKALAVFNLTDSVTYSSILYPVFMFALTVIAFFFFAREIFIDSLGEKKAGAIGLVASFFLSVMPALLPRTIAGIPEKESPGFLFLFLAFYFFLKAWKNKKNIASYSFAILAGLSTAAMALVWGGFVFIFTTIGFSVLAAFILGQTDSKKIYIYSIWLFSSTLTMLVFTKHYTLTTIATSTTTGITLFVLTLLIIDYALFNTKIKEKINKTKLSKIPSQLVSVIITMLAIAILVSVLFGPSFIFNKFSDVKETLITPTTGRLGVTVAENRQPFFTEWAGSFGPTLPAFYNIPVTFWLFFIGSIYLFWHLINTFNKKEKFYLTAAYIFFLAATVFSRYSPNSRFDGTNTASLIFYSSGFLLLAFSFIFYYYKFWKKNEGEKLKALSFSAIFLFIFFFLSIVSARGAVRLIMILVPSASIILSYLAVSLFYTAKENKTGAKKIIGWIIFLIVLVSALYAGYFFYKISEGSAKSYIPSAYNQQWQKAMSWVRENTPENAVFGHWWDYGYWLQSIGKRATVLDGGNALAYWNHLMGRYALTGTSNKDALEFLYAHNTTHFLIDSTDIGKYGAFSFIGSDASLDRRSYIPTLLRDQNRAEERKNSTVFIYNGGFALDEDLIFDNNGTRVFLPAGSGVGAILIERDSSGKLFGQPIGVFVSSRGEQTALSLRYAYDASSGEFFDFGSGVESGVFLFPYAILSGSNIQIDPAGAMLYLSKRTVKSQLARLYLYKEENPNFKLAHSEDDIVVEEIKRLNPSFQSDFIYYNEFRGPLRIWEINYPQDMKLKEEYLSTYYPREIIR